MSKKIVLTYQTNYNGWDLQQLESMSTGDQLEELENFLVDLTLPMCDEDGEYEGDDISQNGEMMEQIRGKVKEIVGLCNYIIKVEMDGYSS